MTNSRAQIVATLGNASESEEVLKQMISHNMDVARLNFSWSDFATHAHRINLVRKLAQETNRSIPLIVDLPGPRIQQKETHTYNANADSAITEQDEQIIKFAAEQKADYIAVSFVANSEDVQKAKTIVNKYGGQQKIIAKIERSKAVENIDEIINLADAIMIARGDMGNEIPLEKIPFVQNDIVRKCKAKGKPVIVATQMLLSMTQNPQPTRAEVTDIENAIVQGADAVMLSEETAKGKYPVEAVAMMEKIIAESEKHLAGSALNLLTVI